ncbi:MAG: protein kinase domain-containing protein [Gemmatimonadales bacterium]
MPAPTRLCAVCGVVVPPSFRFCPSCSSAISAQPTEADRQREALGEALGPRFDVHERIGRGGFGLVFRATDLVLERQVAVKVLRSDLADPETARARFLWGAFVLGQLEHPHIVPIFHMVEAGPLAFIVMPLAGESLAAVLLREGRLAAREVTRILAETAAALSYVHEMGVAHRDIKPQHIMLEGEERRVRLIDFSLAGRRATDGVVGTPAYMSPELAAGVDVDGRSDLYSLGVVGYELLTGQPPFEGTAQQQMAAHRSRLSPHPVVRHQDIPVDLADVVMRCLAKLPSMRWTYAGDLWAALRRLDAAAPAAPAAPVAHAAHPVRVVTAASEVRAFPVVPESLPASAAVAAAVATPPSRAAVRPSTVPASRAAPTVRMTRQAAHSWVRNAPLWVAAMILLLLIGYCAG